MIELKREMLEGMETPEGLRCKLQQAIELEHATLPTYLYSLYSLGNSNKQIQALVLSVIMEEMLHFALACNILNAIAGSPVIDKPGFIPPFPGPLPGGVESGLCVHLKRFSLEHVFDTFMVIEEPEHPLNFALETTEKVTIGMFYTKIEERIKHFGSSIFTGDPRRQVTGVFPSAELFAVTSPDLAVQAIEIIKQQGEGTTKSPLDPEGQPAHYYRFAEIYHGHLLKAVPNPPPGTPDDKKYKYDGAPVPFDPKGVLPVVDDPKAANYSINEQAHYLNDNFNYAYTSLLKVMHRTFNGEPNRLESGIALMHSMRELAMEMMTVPVDAQNNAGPSFEYQPVNS
jgi:hypothetical protein